MIALDRAWLQAHPLPQPGPDTDKNKRGRVLIAGGAMQVPGALRLVGEAAFRAGAGKVQLATVARLVVELGMAVPEAGVFGLPQADSGELAAGAGDAVAGLVERCDTLVLGPGMGADVEADAILGPVLAALDAEHTLVLDAAMLGVAKRFEAELRALNGRVVLTPHPGEMAQMLDGNGEPAALAEQAAARFGAVVALKGAETVIAVPGMATLRYPGGGPGLATGGSGDVLAGIIGGLLARGAEPRVATAWGVWLHGEAGRRLAERVGPLGFLARELLVEIPGLMTL
jgi:ADP-dependent NAD(P)H-hydrate dehydratase